MKFISSILALSIALTSCGRSTDTVDSNDVNEDRVHRTFTAVYKETTKELHLYAQFRLGGPTGTTVRLSDGTNVSVNDQRLSEHDGDKVLFPIEGTFYDAVIGNATPEREYKYRWTRRDGKVFETIIDLKPGPLTLELAPRQQISKSKPFRVKALSAALDSSETLTFIIEGTTADYNRRSIQSSELRSLEHSFQQSETNQFYRDASVYARRSLTRPTSNDDKDIGGTITTQRCSDQVGVEFVP